MEHSHLVPLSSICDVFKTKFDKDYATDAACKETFPHQESISALFRKLNDSTKKQFGEKGVCEDLVICGVKNHERISDLSKFKLTILGYELNFDETFSSGIVIFINLLFGLMVAHLIKKGFEIFTDWPIESFEAESEGDESMADEILDVDIEIDMKPEEVISSRKECNEDKQKPTEAKSMST